MWKKFGTCKICGKRLKLKSSNILPKHSVNKIVCSGSNLPGLNHCYEFIKKD